MATAHLIDLDGTLADTLPDIAASLDHVRAAFGLPPMSLEEARSCVGDGVVRAIERALAGVPLDGAAMERAMAVYSEHHLGQCTERVRVYPGVLETLERWRDEGRPLAVVTNKSEVFVRRILEHLDLERFFAAVVCGDTLPVRKPDPRPLHEALDRMGASRRRGVMIGDGVQDVRAGRAAGLRTVAAAYGYTPRDALERERPDAVWERFGGP